MWNRSARLVASTQQTKVTSTFTFVVAWLKLLIYYPCPDINVGTNTHTFLRMVSIPPLQNARRRKHSFNTRWLLHSQQAVQLASHSTWSWRLQTHRINSNCTASSLVRHIRNTAKSDYQAASNSSALTGRIFMKGFSENLLTKFKFDQNLRIHEDVSTFVKISHWIILRMKQCFRQNLGEIKTHILVSNSFSRKSCPCRLWNYVGKYGRTIQVIYDNTAHVLCIPEN
jgi:hypothetical protein